MDKYEFYVLDELKKEKESPQRRISEHTGISLGKVNRCLRTLAEQQLVANGGLTELGEKELKKYKVDNAIIMAAGMSSRFAPLSYEKPKGLMVVKGEVLIEREIKQLHEAGITDITVVVGYMKEKFFYLREKFGVKIVVNEDYYRYNNPSTLIRVKEQLKNTYICSSDDYFVDNVFEPYVYDSYYAAVYFPGKSDEWGLKCDSKGKITGVEHHPTDMWCMLGHVYFSHAFSKKFREILEQQYELPETKQELWEKLYEKNIKELPMYIRKYEADQVHEFDSLEELRTFDEKYLENTDSKIFKNICRVLNCKESDIAGIQVIKQGLTNLSFRFTCLGQEYVYRHPGVGTEKYISRRSEAFSMEQASALELDKTHIYISAEEGWKISRYIQNARTLNYHDDAQVRQALAMMRKLHDAAIVSDYDFDIWKRTQELIGRVSQGRKNFEDFTVLEQSMTKLYRMAAADGIRKVLCHCDCYDPNFLIDENGEMTLIDWEYSGNDDPANDLGTFICCSDYTYEEALRVLQIYYGRALTEKELRHDLAYIALAAYYWFVWAIYQESIGNTVGEYLLLWYQQTKDYGKRAMALYEQKKEK